jgi:hypothetical protein
VTLQLPLSAIPITRRSHRCIPCSNMGHSAPVRLRLLQHCGLATRAYLWRAEPRRGAIGYFVGGEVTETIYEWGFENANKDEKKDEKKK